MADAKITALTAMTDPIGTDVIPIVDDPAGSPITKKVTLTSLGIVDGWIPVSDTWTYATASTITVPSGAASRYQKGDRIRWTQTTVKYGVVVAVADTVLTIAVNTDYVVANAAISAISYSHEINPLSFPESFAFTTTYTGFAVDPTTVYRMKIVGNLCYILQTQGTSGTSNATGFTFTVPLTSARQSYYLETVGVKDNSATKVQPGHLEMTSGGSTVYCWPSFYETNWTNTGTKDVYCPIFCFNY